MPAAIDLTGRRFGRWTVLGRSPNTTPRANRYICLCDCGTKKSVIGATLTNKNPRNRTTSCGCRNVEVSTARLPTMKSNRTHGLTGSPEYKAWAAAKRRTGPTSTGSERLYYFNRGIRMCQEWRDSFPAFLAHIGPRPDPALSLDRIDNEGHYEPGNVRWATTSEQNSNKRPRFTVCPPGGN